MRLNNKLQNLPIDLEHRKNSSLEQIVVDEQHNKFACDVAVSESATNVGCIDIETQSKAAFLTFLKESRLKNKQTKSVGFVDNVPMTTTSSIKINESTIKKADVPIEEETNDGIF